MAIQRDVCLDLVKGWLVVGMLVIHASTLFIESTSLRKLVYPGVLGFVSGSWVLISGFIVGLKSRADFVHDASAATRRLLGRGVRLMAIFLAANVALGRMSPTCAISPGLGECDMLALALTGPRGEHAFEIIFGISAVLMLAPAYFWWPRIAVLVSTIIIGFGAYASASNADLPPVVWMFSCGAVGIVLGRAATADLMLRLRMEPHLRRVVASGAGLVLCCFLWLRWAQVIGGSSPAFYALYVTSVLLLLYLACVWMDQRGVVGRELTLFAHYSLVCYMAQMAILHGLRLLPVEGLLSSGAYPMAVGLTLGILLLFLHVLDALRSRYSVIDWAYRAVLG